MARRRTARGAVLAGGLVAAGVLVVVGVRLPPSAPVSRHDDLAGAVAAFVEGQHGAREGYRVPPVEARRDLAAAVLAAGAGRPGAAGRLLARHGYHAVDGPDGVRLLLPRVLPDPRGWGLVAVRPGGLPLAVEVPHPRSDLDTDRLGAALAQRSRAQYLVVAGARRDLDGGAADPSARRDSLLSAVHEALASEGVPAVQVHGYAVRSLPEHDLVVSPGATQAGALVRAVADAAERLELRTCRAWQEDCGRLAGRRNVQGRLSAAAGVPFVHLEVSRTQRDSAQRRDALAAAVAGAVRRLARVGNGAEGARQDPSAAAGGGGPAPTADERGGDVGG